jgi:hypothetical protein
MMFRSEPVSGLAKWFFLHIKILMALGTNCRPTEYFFAALGMTPRSNIEPASSIVGGDLYAIVDAGSDGQVLALANCDSNESSEGTSETDGPHELLDAVWAGHVVVDVI